MKRFLAGLLALLFAIPSLALAAPIPYVNTPMDTVQATVNAGLLSVNAGFPSTQPTVACSGTTTATCQGLRIVVSITSLTTAAGVTSATMTVTDASVVATSQIFCETNGYGGTGNPNAVNVVPGAGSFTYAIQNSHASAALNATVPTVCFVYN